MSGLDTIIDAIPLRYRIKASYLIFGGLALLFVGLDIGLYSGAFPSVASAAPGHHLSAPTNRARTVANAFSNDIAAGEYTQACALTPLPKNCLKIIKGLKGAVITNVTLESYKESKAETDFNYSGDYNGKKVNWSLQVKTVRGRPQVTAIK